ncbi:hypothetical protein RXV95_09745 [Novosphingobium sp. ZN18A2]|uniref:hypothetical protein n=1 Tax=Novosphingobium sp. ZN18A2 TaxID=3079861 RepID=UPI0030CD5070
MARPALIATGACCLISSAPALAHDEQHPLNPESQIGTRFKQKPNSLDEAQRRELVNYVALCVQKSVPQRTDWYLRNSDDKSYVKPKGSHNIGTFLVVDYCLGDTMIGATKERGLSTSQSAMRGLLAEQAYLANRRTYIAPPPDSVVPARTFVATGDDLPIARGLAQFEDCIAMTDPAGADALLRTKPASIDEDTAARALAPALGKCLPKGQTLSFTAQSVRSFAAEGMWQRFVAPTAPSYTGQP